MKINNKGFMLIEVIVVSAIISATLVSLYAGFSNTYKAYEIKSSYYDSKTIYALKNMENFLIDEMILTSYITKPNNFYKKIDTTFSTNTYQTIYIQTFISDYNIQSMYITKYDRSALNALKSHVDEDYKKYIDYFLDDNSNEIDQATKPYTFILIAKTNEEKYSSLRIV